MKKQSYYNYLRICGLIATIMMSACGSYSLEEESEGATSSKGYQMSLNVRSNSGDTEQYYPLTVFLFNEEGELIERKELVDKEETFSKTLGKGNYTLTAFSGLSEEFFDIPETPQINDILHSQTKTKIETPLLSGQSKISLTENTQVNIALSYAVSALNFSLQSVPEDATGVEVQVTPISSGISFLGNYTNDNQSSTFSCTQIDKSWESGTFYVFPSESNRTNLSITIKRPGGNETYSYTYTEMLQPSQPYHFTGTFQDGISMGSTFEIEGWKPSIGIDFNLNEEVSDENNNDDTDVDTETILRAPQLPVADKIWGYFYVWKVETISETEVIATLISPDQWRVLAADAPGIIEEYSIDHLDGWRMFTMDEAKEFKKQFASTLDELNYFLDDNGLDRFYRNDGERYLCEEATKTFSFNNNQILNAGKTVKYYLRGVKTVRVKLEE